MIAMILMVMVRTLDLLEAMKIPYYCCYYYSRGVGRRAEVKTKAILGMGTQAARETSSMR